MGNAHNGATVLMYVAAKRTAEVLPGISIAPAHQGLRAGNPHDTPGDGRGMMATAAVFIIHPRETGEYWAEEKRDAGDDCCREYH